VASRPHVPNSVGVVVVVHDVALQRVGMACTGLTATGMVLPPA
jgi:hypothetical protein